MRTGDSMLGRIMFGAVLVTTLSACVHGRLPWMAAGGEILLPPGNLVGTEWVLEDLGGHGVIDLAEATLAFPEPGRVTGNGSCNRFTGSVEITGEALEVGPLAASRRVCPPSVMAQEIKYLKALEDGDRIVRDGPYLLIFNTDVEHPLRFGPRE